MSNSDASENTMADTQPAQKPSQAEGERQTGSSAESATQNAPKPSQAEGDRETVEADIREKEQDGAI